jgi:hypothetical protein
LVQALYHFGTDDCTILVQFAATVSWHLVALARHVFAQFTLRKHLTDVTAAAWSILAWPLLQVEFDVRLINGR